MIAQLNSPEGRGTSFSPLDEGSTYTLALLMYNSFGDTAFVSKSASTFGYFAKDFDRTKTLEDFIGAFGVTATVDVDSQSSEKTFRMDIARINDRDVLISGMTDMRDFAPQLKGYYDKELHMLIVEPQYAGMYNGAYATLGFSNGLSIFWGDAGMAVGYIGDTLYWASSPYSPEEVNSYMFLLFSTPQVNHLQNHPRRGRVRILRLHGWSSRPVFPAVHRRPSDFYAEPIRGPCGQPHVR